MKLKVSYWGMIVALNEFNIGLVLKEIININTYRVLTVAIFMGAIIVAKILIKKGEL